MNYLDLYRARALSGGETPQDRVESALTQDFERLLASSPNRVTLIQGKVKTDAIIQSGNARAGTQTDQKVVQYMMTRLVNKMPEGATFKTYTKEDGNKYWIVLHREIHPYNGYFKYKILELNHVIKYVNKSGVLKEVHTYINGTGEFDIKEYFRYAGNLVLETPNRALNLILAADSDLTKELRILIGGEAWRLVDSDKISIPGVYYATLFKTTTDKDSDNLIEEIANYPDIGDTVIKCNYAIDNNTINIAFYNSDMTFYEIKEGYIQDVIFTYKIEDSTIIKYEDGEFKPLKKGSTIIRVTDSRGLGKVYTVKVSATIVPSIDLVGDEIVPTNMAIVYKVYNSYQNLSFTLSDDSYGYLVFDQNGMTLKFKSLGKVGTVEINAFSGNLRILTKSIEVSSLGGF